MPVPRRDVVELSIGFANRIAPADELEVVLQRGHPEHPVYAQDEVRRVLRNAAAWCAGR